jgi:hypothetical protein
VADLENVGVSTIEVLIYIYVGAFENSKAAKSVDEPTVQVRVEVS